MSKPKKKFYVVWHGRQTGVFNSWDACQEQVEEFKGARFKSYPDKASAEAAFLAGPPAKGEAAPAPLFHPVDPNNVPLPDSIAVDAACAGNPGDMEYRGVYTATGTEIFRSKVYPMGTNNIGEFLALVHALAWQQQQKLSLPIYSDSKIALNWVKQGKARSKLEPTPKNTAIFELIRRAEIWLANNKITVPLRKWETEEWGEIPADFGRKS